MKLQQVNGTYLYNMLQDYRHIFILDFRQSSLSSLISNWHIRNSYKISESTTKVQIIQAMTLVNNQAIQKQLKYQQIKSIRRYFFIAQQNFKSEFQHSKLYQQIVAVINQHFKHPLIKLYSLSIAFEKFYQKYSFMCLNSKQLSQIEDKDEYNKIYYYPFSKFPSQIIPNALYLSNIYSSNCQLQLDHLKITTLIDFISYNEDQVVPGWKMDQFRYEHFPFDNKVQVKIDFDELNRNINSHVQNGQKVLIYCRDGQTISTAFTISYLMYKCKLNIMNATLKVSQTISKVSVNKWMYAQLLLYKPKQ